MPVRNQYEEVRKISEKKNDDTVEEIINETVKFYYTVLKERQSWLMSRAEIKLKNMTALLQFNIAISAIMFTIWLFTKNSRRQERWENFQKKIK